MSPATPHELEGPEHKPAPSRRARYWRILRELDDKWPIARRPFDILALLTFSFLGWWIGVQIQIKHSESIRTTASSLLSDSAFIYTSTFLSLSFVSFIASTRDLVTPFIKTARHELNSSHWVFSALFCFGATFFRSISYQELLDSLEGSWLNILEGSGVAATVYFISYAAKHCHCTRPPVQRLPDDHTARTVSDILYQVVCAPKEDPGLVMLVTGPHGSGKSFLLNSLYDHYRDNKDAEKLSIQILPNGGPFIPWFFDDGEQQLQALLDVIIEEISRHYLVPTLRLRTVRAFRRLISSNSALSSWSIGDLVDTIFNEPDARSQMRSLASWLQNLDHDVGDNNRRS